MDPENPFEPSSSLLAAEPNEGDRLEPVAVEAGTILRRCWELLQRDPGVVLGAIFISFVASIAIAVVQQVSLVGIGMMQGLADGNSSQAVEVGLEVLFWLVEFFFIVVSMAINLYFALGTARIFTLLARGLPANLTLLFGEWIRVPSALLATLIMSIGIMVGIVLFIVPGIILALGLQLTFYAMVDQDLGPVEALRESWRLTDGHKLALFIVGIVMAIFAFVVTCITCGFGYLAVLPLLSLSQAVIYHSLFHLKGPRPLEGM